MENILNYLDAWYIQIAIYAVFVILGYLGAKKIISNKLIYIIGQIAYDFEKKTPENTTIDDILDNLLAILSVFGFDFKKEDIQKKIEADIKN